MRLLASAPLFHDLTEQQLRPLALAATVVVFTRGETIMHQGDAGDSVFIIVDGCVEVRARSQLGAGAPDAVVARLMGGDTVGELALLDGQPRSATCVAVARTRCLMLRRDDFLTALRRHWVLTLGLLRELSQRLRQADALLAEQARDPLTGLGTRRALARVYQRELERRSSISPSDGGPQPLAVLFADVDQLRHINDRFGRAAGDDILRTAGNVLSSLVRPDDVVVRYGADEFVVLLPGADDAQVEALAENARVALRDRARSMSTAGEAAPFTVSIGTAVADAGGTPPVLEHLIMLADLRAYREKAHQVRPLIDPVARTQPV